MFANFLIQHVNLTWSKILIYQLNGGWKNSYQCDVKKVNRCIDMNIKSIEVVQSIKRIRNILTIDDPRI